MQSRTWSAVVVVALVAAPAVLFVVLSDEGDDGEQSATSAAPPAEEKRKPPEGPEPVPVYSLTVRGGEPKGGVLDLEYEQGQDVKFSVRSDVADEVHIHGYDLIKAVGPGKVARFEFPADIDGVFEVELEGSHTQIAELTVQPG